MMSAVALPFKIPKPPPYLVPGPTKRLPKRGYVTLIIGLRCRDGLILCADTQETITGYAKAETDKIATMMAIAGCVSVAGSGDADLVDMIVDALTDHFVLDRCSVTNWRPLEQEIAKIVSPILRNQAQQNAFLPEHERPFADLLIACRAKDGKTLLKLSGTKVKRIMSAQCIGTGMLMANSLVKELFNQNMSLKQAGLLATYIMYRAKRYVDGVGGNTDILFIGDWGLTRIPTTDVQRIESWWLEIEQIGINCARWLTSPTKPTKRDIDVLTRNIDPATFGKGLEELKQGIAFYDVIYADIDAVLNPAVKPQQGMITKITRVGKKSFTQTESI